MKAFFARGFGAALLALALGGPWGAATFAAERSPKVAPEELAEIRAALDRGEPPDVLVVYDAAGVRARAKQLREERRLKSDDDAVLQFKALEYRRLKEQVLRETQADGDNLLRSYSHLPVDFLRIQSRRALEALLAHPMVRGISLPEQFERKLQQSLPLIHQPEAQVQGKLGAGAAVAVLDSGVDYTRAAFGSCTAPGPGCAVVHAQDFAPDDQSLDDNGHGTNVAGIVLGVAPGAKVIALDVFNGEFAYTQDIVSAMNWAIQNKSIYNIVAINLSLGGTKKYTQPIVNPQNPFKDAIDDARAAGILTVAASGNDGFLDGISSPAAVDTAISVGAVYDSAFGTNSASTCRAADTTAPDKVTCFSNSASFLTMLAPGSRIQAAGLVYQGTSQAAPHAAGAVAVMRAAYPNESLNQTVSRVTNGMLVTDDRNGIVKARVDLMQGLALDLVPDMFAFADQSGVAVNTVVESNPVTVSGINGLATLSITAPGEYSVNGGAWLSATRTAANGDVLRVRLTSSASFSATVSTTLTVGGISDTFSVTTSAAPAVPAVQLAPGSVAFGSILVGATSTQTVTLSNIGTGPLGSLAIGVSGQDFALSSTTCGTGVAAGQTCDIVVVFSPSVSASRSGLLTVSSDAPGSPHNVALAGTGVAPISLAEAVDNPDLTITTGGAANWAAQSGVVFFGTHAAQSGAVGNSQSSYMEANLSGPGTVGFYWKVSSEANSDYLRFTVDGIERASISGSVDWAAVSFQLDAGAHVLRWTYARDASGASGADAGWVDKVSFIPGVPAVQLSSATVDFGTVTVNTVASQMLQVTNSGTAALNLGSLALAGGDFAIAADTCSGASLAPSASCSVTLTFSPVVVGVKSGSLTIPSNAPGSPHSVALSGIGVAALSLAEGADNTTLTFASGGNASWFGRGGVGAGGGDAVQSGAIGDGQSTYLETTVTGPGLLKFWWKVSSEAGYDYLSFSFDGLDQDAISGEVDWAQRTYHIGSGAHVLRWIYAKDAVSSSGQDAGWVDQVEFSALPSPANLAEAVDAPDLAWQTYGFANWAGQSVVSISGGDAARSGTIGHGEYSILSTTVRGPGTLSFRWKVSSELDFDGLRFLLDGTEVPAIPAITGEVDWTLRSTAIPAGDHIVEWEYFKDSFCCASGADAGWVDEVAFAPPVPLGEALDNPGLIWSTTQGLPWQGQSVISFFGGDAAESAPIGDGQSTELSTILTGPGTLTFRWKVSSEQGWDFLSFHIDGAPSSAVPQISGEVDWTPVSVAIPAGTHTVKWVYAKDYTCCIGGSDRAWVDQVEFSADAQAPSVPLDLTATAVSASRIDVAWMAATDNVGVTAYKVYRDGALIAILGVVTAYADIGLAASTAYSYTVQACDAAGNCSAPSAAVSATTLPPPAPAVSLSAVSVAFGNVSVGTTATQTITLTNSGAATLVIGTVTLTPSSGEITKTADTCSGASLAPAASCQVIVSFSPVNSGPESGTLSITSNGPGSPHTISVSGTGLLSFIPALQSAWNLLGNSLNVPIDVVATFGDQDSPVAGITNNVVSVWKWARSGAGDKWAFHSPQLSAAANAAFAASKGYDVLTMINPKEAYWVNTGPALTLATQTGAAASFSFFDFDALLPGFSLIAISQQITPTEFNNGVAQLTPPSPGAAMTANFTSLWAWDAVQQKWYFYSPILEASGGLAAVKSYADSQNFLHFQDYSKKLDVGVGFWVNK